MKHSVKDIGARYEELSVMRGDNPTFKAKEFFDFAKENRDKYGLFEHGDDLLFSTWYSDNLINDFNEQIKNKIV